MRLRLLCLALFLAMIFSSVIVYSIDFISDDYFETNTYTLHSYGLVTYGFHDDTCHVSDIWIRGNYNLENDINELQIFATINGFKDTHDPGMNYNYILNNINFYDYGAEYRIFKMFFLSLRGAAPYEVNTDTYLLIPSYYNSYNPSLNTNQPAEPVCEHEQPAQYINTGIYSETPAGIRIGYMQRNFLGIANNFEVAYSQGDYMHEIPSSALARVDFDNLYIRVLEQTHLTIATNYTDFFSYREWMTEISLGSHYKAGDFLISGILEGAYWSGSVTNVYNSYITLNPPNGAIWFRFEEAVTWNEFTLGFRELVMNYAPALYEVSLEKEFFNVNYLGLFLGSDGIYTRIYVGDKVQF